MAARADLKLNENGIPSFDDLPLNKGDPFHSAWGLYGKDDQLGTLNRLTDSRVLASAREEIKTGARFASSALYSLQHANPTQSLPQLAPQRAKRQRLLRAQSLPPRTRQKTAQVC